MLTPSRLFAALLALLGLLLVALLVLDEYLTRRSLARMSEDDLPPLLRALPRKDDR